MEQIHWTNQNGKKIKAVLSAGNLTLAPGAG